MGPTESIIMTWSKFNLQLWENRWDGIPIFTHSRNQSLIDKRCWQCGIYCMAFSPLIQLHYFLRLLTPCVWFGISSFLNSIWVKKADLKSFFTKSNSYQIHQKTNETKWIHYHDMIEVQPNTKKKKTRTHLHTYEKSFNDKSEVLTTRALLSTFLIQLHYSLRLIACVWLRTSSFPNPI